MPRCGNVELAKLVHSVIVGHAGNVITDRALDALIVSYVAKVLRELFGVFDVVFPDTLVMF